MSNPGQHHKINYVEFTTTDIERTKRFYTTVFGWNFKDWGPDYIGFSAASAASTAASPRPSRMKIQPNPRR